MHHYIESLLPSNDTHAHLHASFCWRVPASFDVCTCRFIDNQLANKKTTRVLEAAFNVEWATEYMRRCDEQDWGAVKVGLSRWGKGGAQVGQDSGVAGVGEFILDASKAARWQDGAVGRELLGC
eukprot:771091-Pelagomonas_calceolata.AAC.3